MALLGGIIRCEKSVCVTVILFMTVTVLPTHPDAIQRWPGQVIAWRLSIFLSVFLKASFMHLFDHFCALSRCKRIDVQLKVG